MAKKPNALDITLVEPQIEALQEIRRELESFIFEREAAIKASLTCLIAKEHMLLIGPPGVAKSMIINQLVSRITGIQFFEKGMHSLVTDKDLFVSRTSIRMEKEADGADSVSTVYHTDGGTMATAQVVFLDEIYRANDRTLDSLLKVYNERRYDLNRVAYDALLMSAFMATNHLPDVSGDDHLAAFHDRILMRIPVRPIVNRANQIKVIQTQLARRAAKVTGTVPTKRTIDLSDIETLQAIVPQIHVPEDVMERILDLVEKINSKTGLYISERRIERSTKLLQARALLAKRPEVTKSDLTLLRFVFWNDSEHYEEVEQLIRDNVLDPEEKRLRDLKAAAFEQIINAKKVIADGDLWHSGIQEELIAIRGCLEEINSIAHTSNKQSIISQAEKIRAGILEEQDEVLAAQNKAISSST